MVDSIGRSSLGRSQVIGQKKKNILQKTIKKMEQWRDKARINLFQQRNRYKLKLEKNQALMKVKKSGKLQNLNPSSKLSYLNEEGLIPKARKFAVTHSTVPAKPKYSIVKPKERIHGNKWKKLEKKGEKNARF